MAKQTSNNAIAQAEHDTFSSATTIAALLFLAAKFPHRQFNSAELCVLSGVGRTAISQIKNASDSPFSLGKCTLQRLDGWLAKNYRRTAGRYPGERYITTASLELEASRLRQ